MNVRWNDVLSLPLIEDAQHPETGMVVGRESFQRRAPQLRREACVVDLLDQFR